jgi:hypothetical protein
MSRSKSPTQASSGKSLSYSDHPSVAGPPKPLATEADTVSVGASIPGSVQTASAPLAGYSLRSGRRLRLSRRSGMLHYPIVVNVDFRGCDRGWMGRRGG